MPNPYRVAVIGSTGHGNYGHGLDTVWKDVPRAKVVAVADDDAGGLKAAQQRLGVEQGFLDYREMLEKVRPEIVAIAPRWIGRRHEMALAVAEHGCHIYIEKPFCPTLAEADEIRRALEMRHLKLAISHQARYSESNAVVKQLLADGVIGDLLEVRARGKEDRRGGGEDLWVLGTHMLDLMNYFAGPPQSCWSRMTQDGEPVTERHVAPGAEELGPLAGDHVTAVYTLSNGAMGYFDSQRNAGGRPSRFAIRLYGSKGVIDIPSGYLSKVSILQDSSWAPGQTGSHWEPITSNGIGKPETLPGAGSLHYGNIRAVNDLIDCIESGDEPLGGINAAIMTIEMVHAVFESHRVGHAVEIPLENRRHPLTMLDPSPEPAARPRGRRPS